MRLLCLLPLLLTAFPCSLSAVDVQMTLHVQYEDLETELAGATTVVLRPVGQAKYEILGDDGGLLAFGRTGPNGRADVTFQTSSETTRIIVMATGGSRGIDFSVRTSFDEILAFETSPHPPESQMDIEILIPQTAGGGAFNIFATILPVLEWLEKNFGVRGGLTVVYDPGVAVSCGSCFLPYENCILIGGGPEDPDQNDDSILLHELGHYFEHNYSASSSIGGSHDGSPTYPSLAWSEGFATFFGQSFIGSSIYIDTYDDSQMEFDLEADYYLSDVWKMSTIKEDISEDLVGAILWDLLDDEVEAHDRLSNSIRDLLSITVYCMVNEYDAGYEGIDLADFIRGWLVCELGYFRSLMEITHSQGYPYPFRLIPLE